MKKSIFLLILLAIISLELQAQHDYDSENVVFSTKNDDGSNSKVGIDINSPQEKLHVNGSLLLEAFNHTTGVDEKGIFFKQATPTTLYGLSILTYDNPSGERGALGINAVEGIYFNTGSYTKNTRMFIKADGSVGIGTETPTEKLEINGNLFLNDGKLKIGSATTLLAAKTALSLSSSPNVDLTPTLAINDDNEFGKVKVRGTFISMDGNMGIGTEAPTEKLEINGNLFVNDGKLKIGSTTNSLAAKTALSISSSPSVDQTPALAINDGNEFETVEVKATKIALDGNVGVGTSNPLEKLDVRGKTVSESMLVNPNGDNGFMLQMGNQFDNDRRNFNFGYADTGTSYVGYSVLTAPVIGIPKAPIAEYLDINDRSSIPAPNTDPNYIARLQFSAKNDVTSIGITDPSGSEIFKAARSGQYGSFIHMPKPDSRLIIGGTGDYLYSEGYKLVVKDGNAKVGGELTLQNQLTIESGGADVKGDVTVAGKILAREVKVDITAGADFVFESGYGLRPLREVEEFVTLNGHLPEIATAREMEENGLDLGAMNIKLLQKIEELTLYIIEQEKSIRDQEERLKKMEVFLKEN